MVSFGELFGEWQPHVQFAVEAVREAAVAARQVQRDLAGAAVAKEDRSPVTVADFAAQALVAARLAEAYPQAVLVGEESAAALREPGHRDVLEKVVGYVRSRRPTATPEQVCQWIDRGATGGAADFWTLDPIDGTKGFLRRDQYAVALAFLGGGNVRVAVLGCPELTEACVAAPGGRGTLLVAVRGRGAWRSRLFDDADAAAGDGGSAAWQRTTVSAAERPEAIRLLRSVEAGHTDAEGVQRLAGVVGIRAEPIPLDSQAKYAVLAAGGGEAVLRLLSPQRLDYRERIWDQAAGALLVEEAGGRVTDLDGRPLDFAQGRTLAGNRGVLATNGRVHEALLQGLRQIGA
jgi:3'(2'), 5'-bisphosphate nucleotidase